MCMLRFNDENTARWMSQSQPRNVHHRIGAGRVSPPSPPIAPPTSPAAASASLPPPLIRGSSRASSMAGLHSVSSTRSEEHTSELQSHHDLVCRLLLEKKKNQFDHKYLSEQQVVELPSGPLMIADKQDRY